MTAQRQLADNEIALARHLTSHGVQATRQRLRIAAILLSLKQHLTAEQLLDQLRERGLRVSKATVYNTLNLFANRGLIRQLALDGQRTWFDSNIEAHSHFQDVHTGTLTDFNLPNLQLEGLPPLPAGMEIEAVDLVVRLRRRVA